MSDTNPHFSVIIPTKDRAEYLHHSLRTCSMQDYDNLDIIVSDDGSRDNTREVVEEAGRKDPRIRYVSPGGSVGMRDNFEFALNCVRPGYVMALGGDDGLMPYGIQGMRDLLLDSQQELLAWATPAYFYAKAKMETGQLVLPLKSKQKLINSQEFLERQARDLFYVADVESPMFYVKGVTSTRLVERVRSRSADGRFYVCSTPDGYSGIVLAGEVQSYAFSGVPFSLHGVSPSSHGVGYLSGDEKAKKQSEAFFKSATNVPMHTELGSEPYSPLISLMTADYLMTARDLPGWPGTFPPINFKNLLVKSLDELADGLFAKDRVTRELVILNRIAEHHGLGDFFRQKVRGARRNIRKTLEGNAISPARIYVDCTQYAIHNVFDAAFVAYYIHQFANKTTWSNILNIMGKSLNYRLRSMRIGDHFPSEQEWDTGKKL